MDEQVVDVYTCVLSLGKEYKRIRTEMKINRIIAVNKLLLL